MKNVWSIIFIGCIVLAATFSHAEEPLEPTSADVYREQGVTIVLPDDWKPFSFVDASGERTGYLMDLWRAWAAHSEIDVRFEFKGEQDALESMANNATDILGGLYYSDDHAEFFDHAGSVYSSTSLLAIRDDGSVDCANVLSDGAVGIVDDANTKQLAEGLYPDSNMVMYPDAKRAISAIMNGEVDGIAIGYPHLALADKEQSVLEKLNICRTLFYHEVYAGVQKGETELLTLVSDGLNEIPADELKQIKGQWFLTAERPKPKWLGALLPAAVALILIVGIVVLWFRRRR